MKKIKIYVYLDKYVGAKAQFHVLSKTAVYSGCFSAYSLLSLHQSRRVV